jgi:predicted phosphodiesterase/energy-coupling factor transporter ATP-binding protein EcfA2
MAVTILHLSDLHISREKMHDITIVLQALFNDIGNMNEKIDFILFNGDLINNGSLGAGDNGEYRLAEEKFIKPLLKATGLTKDRFFLVPGNHDVNRNAIKKWIDADLTDKFNSRDELNAFIDCLEENKTLFARLKDYHEFVREFHSNHQNLITQNELFSTYVFEHEGIKIGFACLNSSWGAFGGPGDLGKLLVGERQVDNALNDLRRCDIKIAMIHHPLEWLKEFDRESIHGLLITNFDLVLTGHIHSPNSNQLTNSSGKSVFVKAGSLFDGRSYNGYSVIKIDTEKGEVQISFREYVDRRRAFDVGISVAEQGVVSYSLPMKDKLEHVKKKLDIRRILKNKIIADLNKKLIPSMSSDTIAPKEISEIYVPPYVSTVPENFSRGENEAYEMSDDIETVLQSHKNILFIGRKESGKSTLLSYVFTLYAGLTEGEVKIPFIIDFVHLPKGKKPFENAMINFLHDYDIRDFNVQENLEAGNCVVMIDNLDVKNAKNIEKLREFCSKYPNNKFVFAMNENILQTVRVENLPDLGCEYATYYIYTFRRTQVRQLVKKWFINMAVDDDVIMDHVITSLRRIGVPQTPLTISLLLSIIEKQKNYVPLNEAALIEKFILIILEKLNFEEARYDVIDSTIKLDFLSYLAYRMVQNNKFYFDLLEFDREMINYFSEKALEIETHNFKQSLFEKGLFIQIDQKIYFRYKCFFEFFVAKYMQENPEFKKFVLSENQYLKYINEIVCLTGLTRKDLDILKEIEQRILNLYSEIDPLVEDLEISRIPIKQLLTESLRSENLETKLKEMRLDDKEKDKFLDIHVNDSPTFIVKKEDPRDRREELINVLTLYAKIIRNCELIDKTEKKKAFGICIEKYCKLTRLLYKILFTKLQEMEEEPEDNFVYFIVMVLPIIVQNMLLYSLGTQKLKVTIEEHLKESKDDFEKFMLVSLYGDLKLEGYIKKFEEFLKTTDSKLIRELSICKLLYYNSFYKNTDRELFQLWNLLGDLITQRNNQGKMFKSRYIEKLKQQSYHTLRQSSEI